MKQSDIESIITRNSCEWYDDKELMCDYVPVKHVSKKICDKIKSDIFEIIALDGGIYSDGEVIDLICNYLENE